MLQTSPKKSQLYSKKNPSLYSDLLELEKNSPESSDKVQERKEYTSVKKNFLKNTTHGILKYIE